jgi:hypothetical protein
MARRLPGFAPEKRGKHLPQPTQQRGALIQANAYPAPAGFLVSLSYESDSPPGEFHPK